MTFQSTGIRPADGDFIVDGELTIKGITKPVELKTEVNGFGEGPLWGHQGRLLSHRRDQPHRPRHHREHGAAHGGVIVSEKIQLVIEAEASLKQ
jgi:hypothetical protein